MDSFKDKVAVVTGGAQGIDECSYEEFQYAINHLDTIKGNLLYLGS